MYDKEKPDIVIIGTPHFLHAPMAIAAAERNINVLTEKPMCINLKQADAMAAAVEKSKIKLAVGFQHRFNPIYVAMKRLIDSGDLGDIFQMNMMFHWWRNEKYYLNSSPVPENKDEDWEGWRGHWKTEGAGALANQIVHFMDVFQWLSPSRPKSIMAASRVSKHTLVETDDNTNAIVEFENGSMGFIQAGVAYEFGREEEYRIYGTKGAIIRANNLKGPLGIPKFYEDLRPKVMKAKRSMLSLMPKSFDFSKALFTNFLQAILKDDPKSISVDVHEGRKSIEIMRGIILSQKYEKKIAIPFEDTPTDFPKLLHTYVDPEFKDMV
jgi:predicted dehydrogenase